jgi:ElaA protein
MRIRISAYNELTLDDLYSIMRLRQEVFVVEQDCPYLDADGKDQVAHHLLYERGTKLLGYSRLLAPCISYPDYTSIGRVVTAIDERGKAYGRDLMQASIAWCAERHPGHDIKISAQCYLDRFYAGFGFVDTGDHYLEDGIPHQAMVLSLADVVTP